jgi:hypothetical protein
MTMSRYQQLATTFQRLKYSTRATWTKHNPSYCKHHLDQTPPELTTS